MVELRLRELLMSTMVKARTTMVSNTSPIINSISENPRCPDVDIWNPRRV
jgi:hypothetical protein